MDDSVLLHEDVSEALLLLALGECAYDYRKISHTPQHTGGVEVVVEDIYGRARCCATYYVDEGIWQVSSEEQGEVFVHWRYQPRQHSVPTP